MAPVEAILLRDHLWKKGKQQLHHQRQNAKQLLTIHVKIVFTYFMLLPSRF